MSQICIFGNSHLGALAQSNDGLDRLRAAGHEVFFWGIAGKNFEKLVLDDTVVTSPVPAQSLRISGGRCEHLDLSVPDVIVFYGFNVGPSYQARSIAVPLQRVKKISTGLRDALIKEEIDRMWDAEIACSLIGSIAETCSGKPMLFAPQPLVAEDEHFLRHVTDRNALFEIQERLMDHYKTWMDARGIRFFSQPPSTISDRFFTKSQYTKGSVRLVSADAHRAEDIIHMNSDFGSVMLDEITRILG